VNPTAPPSADPGVLLARLRGLSVERREELKRRLRAPRESGYSLVAEALRRCGIKRVLGVSGVPMDQLFTECSRRDIRPIGMRHQQAATLAAAAGNFIAGCLESAVVISSSPAVTNTLTGVLTARDNGWPLLVMGGRTPIGREGIGLFQEFDAVPVVKSVTKWAAVVRSTSALTDSVQQACKIALEGRPGPVYLELPQDVLTESAEATDHPGLETVNRLGAGTRELETVAELLSTAESPLLVLGDGVRWCYDRDSLDRLVNDFGIPFMTTSLGRGMLPDGHPLCQNLVRRWVQSQADVVIMVGACFDWRFRFGAELRPGARIVHVDVEPVALGRNVPDATTILADGGRFLTQLAATISESGLQPSPATLDSWYQRLQNARRKHEVNRSAWLMAEARPMLPQQLFRGISAALPADALIVLDGSVCLSTGQKVLSAEREWSWLDPGWSGCMGSGIPFALGAKLVRPERPVVVACGDFAFGISAMELETAVRHRIPIIVVIVNNDGIIGSTRQSRHFPADYPELFCQFLPALRYEHMMEMFGGHAEWVEAVDDIQPALNRALQSNRPSCINVRVKPDTPHPGSW
jgi:thiamine pyrophosphate-dependent acetolactate synthase large subunit-like protein